MICIIKTMKIKSFTILGQSTSKAKKYIKDKYL